MTSLLSQREDNSVETDVLENPSSFFPRLSISIIPENCDSSKNSARENTLRKFMGVYQRQYYCCHGFSAICFYKDSNLKQFFGQNNVIRPNVFLHLN